MNPDRIAPEWTGLARAARSRFIADATISGKTMRAIIGDMEAEYERKGTAIARRMLERAQSRWLAIGTAGCLSQSVVLDNRHLTIIDVRVTGSTATSPRWTDGATEAGCCIIENRVEARARAMVWSAPLLVGISLHALGRWHQRAWRNDAGALHNDLRTLAAAAPSLRSRRVGSRSRCRFPVVAHGMGISLGVLTRSSLWISGHFIKAGLLIYRVCRFHGRRPGATARGARRKRCRRAGVLSAGW